jgi:integrase
VRIGEALATSWDDIDLGAGTARVEYTIVRLKGVGLLRKATKAAATELDGAGLTARQIADQLGHSRPSITQDFYMGRRTVTSAAADALDRAYQRAGPGEPGRFSGS